MTVNLERDFLGGARAQELVGTKIEGLSPALDGIKFVEIVIGGTSMSALQVGHAEARDNLADLLRAAAEQPLAFRIGNLRNRQASSAVLIGTETLLSWVMDASKRPRRKGEDILASMPYAGTGLPELRLLSADEDVVPLRVPDLGADLELAAQG